MEDLAGTLQVIAVLAMLGFFVWRAGRGGGS